MAFVAAFIPMKPASIEERAPARNARAVEVPIAQARSNPTTTTKPARTVYSRRRKAIDPISICSAMSLITALPAGCFTM